MTNFLDLDNPEHMLLIRAYPGTGKTHAAVHVAEASAARGRRVVYYGPRHDFFNDVTAIAREQSWWYEWLPRQEGDDKKLRTCEYVPQINSWLEKGYKGIEFCKKVCGWDYINGRCTYHAQKKRPEPIIFAQHAHAALGHPLEFSIGLGDESSLQAFLHKWHIPAERVMPKGMDVEDPLTEIIYHLRTLAETDYLYHGPELLEALGGASGVKEAAEQFTFAADKLLAPSIHSAYEAEGVDYAHLLDTASLLAREAAASLAGQRYAERIWAGKGKLTLLLRRAPADKLPRHLIWLDATGDEHIYEELFGRPVKIIDIIPKMTGSITVIADRANGKGSLMDENGKATDEFNVKSRRVVERVVSDYGFKKPGLITFKNLLGETWLKDYITSNFYGARGTNYFERESVDALFQVGAPLPAMSKIKEMAAQIYFKRMRAFDAPWSTKWVAYNHIAEDGHGREYPAGGFWSDDDLQALVWQFREAEILQNAHRVRPLIHNIPVFLLVNVPVPQLPVDHILTDRDILDVPEGFSIDLWLKFMAWLGNRESVTLREIRDELDMSDKTATKYFEALGWEMGFIKTKGRPKKVAIRTKNFHVLTL